MNKKPIGKWSKKYDFCQKCGTTESPYRCKGLCFKCYHLNGYISHPKNTHINMDLIQKFYDQGKSFEQIGTIFNVSGEAIRKRFREVNMYEPGRWSLRYSYCKNCRTDKIPHEGYGLCEKCSRQSPKHKARRKLYGKRHRGTLGYKDAQKKRAAKWYQEHKKEKKEYKRKYGKERPDVAQRSIQKRRALKRNVYHWLPFYDFIWKWSLKLTFGWCPGYIRSQHFVGIDKLTMDHVIPLNKGGIHSIANVQPLCKSCNSKKHDRRLFS